MEPQRRDIRKSVPFLVGVLLCAAPFFIYPRDGWGFPDDPGFHVFLVLSWTAFTIWCWTIWASWVLLARMVMGIYVGFFTCVFMTFAIWQLRTALSIAF